MAYVRKKRVRDKEHYQLVEGWRENGKVRQRVLCHLGQYPSVDVALERIPFLIKIAPYRGRNRAQDPDMYTSYRYGNLEYSHEIDWMYKEATDPAGGFLQKK